MLRYLYIRVKVTWRSILRSWTEAPFQTLKLSILWHQEGRCPIGVRFYGIENKATNLKRWYHKSSYDNNLSSKL